MTASHDADHVPSYYAATCNDARRRPPLQGTIETDVCVVGAGFSGLATALHLAERGYGVVVLEARRIGWGASGRNGGQLVNGYSRDLDVIAHRYGPEAARALGDMAFEGGHIIREWIARYAIDCDYREGGIAAALNRRQLARLEALIPTWERHGHSALERLDARSIRDHVSTDLYVGGLLDRWGGHLHPLNLAVGEAAAVESLGGRLYEDSPAVRVTGGAPAEVLTGEGMVSARHVVLCGNAYLGATVMALRDRVMPVATQVVVTEPLGEATARRLIPGGVCVEDCNYMLDYYRMTADHRLLFGGGTVYGGREPGDIRAQLHPHVRRTFPELGDVRFDYAWSGNFALTLTRIPHLGRLPDGVWFTHGYSGHGVTTTHLAGRLLAEAIAGEGTRFEAFARLHNVPFPGGRLLRVPLTALGAWYYRLRDRLGL